METCIPPCVNGQGTCESGICVCVPPYTGPSCHNGIELIITILFNQLILFITVSQPIIIDNKNSTPSVSVQVQGLNSAKFSISLTEMYEKGAGAAIYNRADLSTANYTLVIKNYPSYTFWNYSTILHQVSNVQMYLFFNKKKKTLSQFVFLLLARYIYYFNYTTSNFEGTNTTIQANTIKMALSISDWPFRDITHSLFVVFSNDISNKTTDSPIEACTRQTSSNHAMNLRWYKISVEGVSLYAQMEEVIFFHFLFCVFLLSIEMKYGILDGRKRAITFTSTNTSQVTIRAPFFWNNLILDPNFGVLLEDDDPCSSRFIDGLRNHKATWQYYLIIPIVAVFVVIGLLFWKFDKIRLWNKFRSPPKLVFEVDQNEDL